MTINTQKLRRIGTLLDEGYQINDHSGVVTRAADEIARVVKVTRRAWKLQEDVC